VNDLKETNYLLVVRAPHFGDLYPYRTCVMLLLLLITKPKRQPVIQRDNLPSEDGSKPSF
jgi:hypothetical protein